MSGGSLEYVYHKVEEAAYAIKHSNISTLHNAFANHLLDIAQALHDIEWVLSSDMGEGDDVAAIKKVINKERHLEQVVEEARKINGELQTLLLGI